MVIYKELNFSGRDYEYNLDINSNITQIDGNSGVGKTLMFKDLKYAINNNEINTEEHPILMISEIVRNIQPEISNKEGYLIIIDNFDEISADIPDIINQIDIRKNQYILISRSIIKNIPIDIWDIATLVMNDNKFSLEYLDPNLRREMRG